MVEVPKIPKWPFAVGDALLLAAGAAVLVVDLGAVTAWHYLVSFLCVASGGLMFALPFLLDHRAAVRLAEADGLATTVGQIQRLDAIAERIGNATALWQGVQESALKTNAAAQSIAEKIAAEAIGFAEFMEKANEAEKGHLRLEVEKLRRAGGDWLQVVVRTLDHVHALFTAAVRSGQPHLIEQLGNFQNACRDAARRVGLVAFEPIGGAPFDSEKHQLPDTDAQPPAGAQVAQMLAPGFTFQGQLLRKAIVSLGDAAADDDLSIRQLNQQRARTQEAPPSEPVPAVAVAVASPESVGEIQDGVLPDEPKSEAPGLTPEQAEDVATHGDESEESEQAGVRRTVSKCSPEEDSGQPASPS
jgi:molecular chaperone GrpE (heat shock protein)